MGIFILQGTKKYSRANRKWVAPTTMIKGGPNRRDQYIGGPNHLSTKSAHDNFDFDFVLY